ncbi:hypothetical protein TH15OA1_110110 [Vibrio harveyi]|nr:hypothetical protein TH15OA1_110110 [Vibrio harveyi]
MLAQRHPWGEAQVAEIFYLGQIGDCSIRLLLIYNFILVVILL